MGNIQRTITGILGSGMVLLLSLPVERAAGAGSSHSVTVVDGSSLSVVFSAPDAESWNWRLTVGAGGDWCHILGTQGPNSAPWVLQSFSRRSLYWSVPVTDDSPERRFQIRFYGQLEPCNPEGGDGPPAEPVVGEWEVLSETADYYVLPAWTNICAGGSATFRAVDALDDNALHVPSTWSVVPSDGVLPAPLPPGSTVSLSLSRGGGYSVTGQSIQHPDLSDSALVNAILIDIADSEVTACAQGGVELSLTDDSFMGHGGTAAWFGGPGRRILGGGRSITIHPEDWPGGIYTITARSTLLSCCEDTCELKIIAGSLGIPLIIGVNDMVPSRTDQSGAPSGFVATAEEFDGDDDLEPVEWSVDPGDVGEVSFTGDDRVRVLMRAAPGVAVNPSFPAAAADTDVKIEGVQPSMTPGDAVVSMTMPATPCSLQATTTVVQVKLDKASFTRVNPMPRVDVLAVTGLEPGGRAVVLYRVAGDILKPQRSAFRSAFPVASRLGTYEYKTPPFVNRLGNQGWGSLCYTVFDENGTRRVRWVKADPSHPAISALPATASMNITLYDALAETPAEALAHLAPSPAFAGYVDVQGACPEFAIPNIKLFPRPPSPALTNEICATIGGDVILQTLHDKAQASAAVLELAGPRTVGVNDRFGEDDPGDDAGASPGSLDPDFVELTLQGLPDSLRKGSVVWTASGGVRLVHPATGQVGQGIRHHFEGAAPDGDMLRVHVEGRTASDAIEDAQVLVTVLPAEGFVSGNPRAFWGRPFSASSRLTVTDLRWTGWKPDNVAERTPERVDYLTCDLDLRPAVRIDGPSADAAVTYGSPLTVSGTVRSMIEIVRHITVNGEPVPSNQILFLGQPVSSMSADSVRDLTDRPPPLCRDLRSPDPQPFQ